MNLFLLIIMLYSQMLSANDSQLSMNKAKVSEFEACLDIENSKKIVSHTLKSKRFKKTNIKVLESTSTQIKAITSTGKMGVSFGYEITIDLSQENKNKTKLKLLLKGRNGRLPGRYYSFNFELFKSEFLKIYERWPNKLDCKTKL